MRQIKIHCVRYVRHLIRKEKEKLQRRKVVTKSGKVLNAATPGHDCILI